MSVSTFECDKGGGSDEVDGRKIQERRRHLTLKTLFIKDVKPSLQVQR